MQQKTGENKSTLGKRLSSIFIVVIMLLASIIGFISKPEVDSTSDVKTTSIQQNSDFIEIPAVGNGPPIQNTTICGYVNNTQGEMLSGVGVSAYNITDVLANYTAPNGTGYYTFKVSNGSYNFSWYTLRYYPHYNESIVDVNTTYWHNITLVGSNITIAGKVRDKAGLLPLPGIVNIFIEGEPGLDQNEFVTYGNGNFSVNVDEYSGIEGIYSIEVERVGYVAYGNWDNYLVPGDLLYLNITMDAYFDAQNYSHIRGRVNESGDPDPLLNATIILLDTNFNHMFKGMSPEKQYENNETGWFYINITYPSTYLVIAFVDGYYVDFTQILLDTENMTYWNNVSFLPALPGVINVTVEFTDLDDATVTVSRTIRAESPIVRFMLDFMMGDGDQSLSATEIGLYMQTMNQSGPGVLLDIIGSPQDDEENQGGPSFFAIPMQAILDESYFDDFVKGSHQGSLGGLLGTNVTSIDPIFYNATFGLTLDGLVPNITTHTFNLSLPYNLTDNINFTFRFGDIYTISSIVSHSTNLTHVNDTKNISLIPGSGEADSYAVINISLDLDPSISLPIIEVPTWHLADRWAFNSTENEPGEETIYAVDGKPLQRWERQQYYVGGEDLSYLCYFLTKQVGANQPQMKFVTITELDWLNITGNHVNYLIDDLAFPLYNGKTWATTSWWGQSVNATISTLSEDKYTGNGTFSCINITYTNASDPADIVAREWYSPVVKFFVNRTRYVNDEIETALNMTSYSLSPFIYSVTVTEYEDPADLDLLINSLNVAAVINSSQYYDGPTNYRIEGPIRKDVDNGPSIFIAWMWNETALENLEKDLDGTIATLSYSGALINASGVDGPYTIEVQLRKISGGGQGQQVDRSEIETNEYTHTDFQSPAISILALDDAGNDTNDNGYYDYLTENVTLNVLEDGNYSINAGLNYMDGNEPRWLTGTGTGRTELNAGDTPTIQLNFDGTDIYEQGRDSPYRINIEIRNDDTHLIVIQNESDAQGTYAASQFERPSIYFNRTWMGSDEYGDHDFINESTYLTINTSIIVVEGTFSGGTETYDLHSGMEFTNDGFVTGSGRDIILHEGENILPVNFNIGDIYTQNNSYNGTFTMHLGFCQHIGDWYGPDIDNSMYITQQYNLNDPESFPPPPITLELVSDAPSGDETSLTVHGWVNITSETYTDVDLDLHGGLHWIEGDNWHFITGMGDTVSYTDVDDYEIDINFSGMEIAGSGQSGPYSIWMGIETIPEHERIAECEYETDPWTPDDFAQPGAEFVDENTSEFRNGTDFLTVNTSINISTLGTYQIGGGIHLIQHMNGWDNWVFITGTGERYTLTKNANLSFNFDQGMIRTALETYDYSGALMVSLQVQNSTTGQQIDRLEFNTRPYTASIFSAAAVVIESATPSIENGDLVVNITYNATRNDTYRINGGLHTLQWYFITGTSSEAAFTVGEHSINLTFDGGQIYNSAQNGPYRLWIGAENTTTHRWVANIEVLPTPAWHYNDFSAPEVRFIRDAMTAGDADYLNEAYLTINVSINATAAGNYRLDSGLNYVENYNWQWITGAGRDVTLSEGENIIPLNFNAGDIQASGKNGPYRVWLGVRNITTWTDIDHFEYTTKAYQADDFPAPPIVFEEMIEGDPAYGYINGSYFSVNVTLEVNGTEYEGTYDLHGGVAYQPEGEGWWQHLTGGGSWVDLANGTNNITLNFNAGEIKNGLPEDYDDNLSVYIGLSNISTWTEITHTEYITQNFSSDVFPPPAITVTTTGDYINSTGGTEYFTLNVTITLNETTGVAGEYDVNGGIHWIDDSQGWEQWRFITGTGGPRTLAINDTEIALNFNAGDIYNALSENDYNGPLVAWVGVNNRTTWENLAHDEYRTPDAYSIDDFSAPSLIINCSGDYNNASDYLTVNVTINATGTSLNQNYDIHAGLHWRNNQQWEWITGYGTSLDLIDNITIPLNFNGGAIRSAGYNDTYEIWVGISEQGQWQDLTHDQYTTGSYTYDEFAPPAVEILDDQITDYANDSTYLTFNVTVDVNQTGDYFIESCLHWRNGYQWNWITWAGGQVTILEEGVQNITLNFDGIQIAQAAENGWPGGTTLIAWIAIRNATTWAEIDRIDEHTTQQSYSPGNFMEAPVTFNRSTPIVYDNESGNLNALVSLNNTHAQGNYTIQAGLFTSNNRTFVTATSGWISYLNDSVTLTFDGEKIYKKNYNGTYEFRAKIFDNVTYYEYDRIVDITDNFSYDNFTQSMMEARIIGTYTNVTIGNYIVVNVTINITSDDLNDFKLYADLFNETNAMYITSNSTTIIDAPFENVTATLNFNRTAINATGESLPYLLTYVRLSILNEGVWEELEVKTPDYIVTGGE